MIRNKLFLSILIILITNACSYNRSQQNKDYIHALKVEESKSETDEIIELEIKKFDFPLSFIYIKESEQTFVVFNNKEVIKIDLNWEFKEQGNNENYFLFKGDEAFYLVYSVYSEEFPTFEMIEFSSNGRYEDFGTHTFSSTDVEKLNNNLNNVTYLINFINDIPRLNAKSKKTILLSKSDNVSVPYIILSEKESLKIINSKRLSIVNDTINWDGEYLTIFDIVRNLHEDEIKYRFLINNKETSLKIEINNEFVETKKLYIDSITEKMIRLKSIENQEDEFIISRLNNSFFLSGSTVYLLNPPNENYEIVKIKN